MQILIPMLTELEFQGIGNWHRNFKTLVSKFDAHQKLKTAADRHLPSLIILAAINSASESSQDTHRK